MALSQRSQHKIMEDVLGQYGQLVGLDDQSVFSFLFSEVMIRMITALNPGA